MCPISFNQRGSLPVKRNAHISAMKTFTWLLLWAANMRQNAHLMHLKLPQTGTVWFLNDMPCTGVISVCRDRHLMLQKCPRFGYKESRMVVSRCVLAQDNQCVLHKSRKAPVLATF